MFKNLKKFVIPVMLMVAGVQFVGDYLGTSEKERRNELELLVSDGIETNGVLKESYKQKTITRANIPIDEFEIGYTFSVDGKQYEGTSIVYELPNNAIIELTYYKGNPKINGINPQTELSELEEGKGSVLTLLAGIVFFLIGAFWLYALIRPKKENVENADDSNRRTVRSGKEERTTVTSNERVKNESPESESSVRKDVSRFSFKKKKPSKIDKPIKSKPKDDKFSNLKTPPKPLMPKSELSKLKNTKLKEFEPTDHSRFLPK